MSGEGPEERIKITREHEETLGIDGYIHYLDRSYGPPDINICQNLYCTF